jgi:hypothetical protein
VTDTEPTDPDGALPPGYDGAIASEAGPLADGGATRSDGGTATPLDASAAPGPDGAVGDVDGGPHERLRVVADDTGIQELWYDGVNLFSGVGGYYIIGSCTGADDANNVTSGGSDGRTLRAPGSCPGAPFRMEISGTDPIRVSIEIGPLPVAYRTLSVPLDPVKTYFTEFSFDGASYEVGCGVSYSRRSGSGGRYDTIPTPCTIPGVGGVGVARVSPAPGWGEITGPVATIRRTFLSGDAGELAFINHPGSNNIEPGFNPDFRSTIPAGTVVRLEEEIRVTAPRTGWPEHSWRFEAEGAAMQHEIGRAEGDGWSANTAADATGTLSYGPYARDLPAGRYEAVYRMMIDNNSADSLVVLRVDVNDYGMSTPGCGGCTVAARDIRRTDFAAAGAYQEFVLPFTWPGIGHALEMRTYWQDRAYVRQDWVEVRPLP